ncbi:MAG TPA: hypothetical protein VM055_00320 [Novosphingobium sp.]|nr:hypothetical protein [Novosphingobium sp.]
MIAMLHPLGDDDPGSDGLFRASFVARETGELFVFVNDAAFLRQRRTFYCNNQGTARVQIRDIDAEIDAAREAEAAPAATLTLFGAARSADRPAADYCGD